MPEQREIRRIPYESFEMREGRVVGILEGRPYDWVASYETEMAAMNAMFKYYSARDAVLGPNMGEYPRGSRLLAVIGNIGDRAIWVAQLQEGIEGGQDV